MLNKALLKPAFVLCALFLSISMLSCGTNGSGGDGNIAGKYISEENPEEYLILYDDGTFYTYESSIGMDGDWEVKGNDLLLHSSWGISARGEIQGNTIYDEDGVGWVKENSNNNALPTDVYSPDFDLRNMLGFQDWTITAQDITNFIQMKFPNSPMLSETNIGSVFIDAGLSNMVNPAFLVAVAYLEGQFGTAGWALTHPDSHNTMGWGIPSSNTIPNNINSAASWGEMVSRVAERIANGPYYYQDGLFTVNQVRTKYASEPNTQSIVSIMNELLAFSQ